MKTPKHSLRKIVSFLNNSDEDGGFWLPNIQRPFVWSEDQISRLFDSILREYPISTLLIWKTRAEVRHRKFIDNYRSGLRLSDFYVPENGKKKCLVLDGQQRLQSLFIGLCGSYEGRELFLDILSGEVSAPDDVKFRFAFLNAGKTAFPWIRFKDLVFHTADPLTAAEDMIARASRELSHEERRKISRHVGIVFKTFHSDDGISYQELDSTENAELYTEDDVVEVFSSINASQARVSIAARIRIRAITFHRRFCWMNPIHRSCRSSEPAKSATLRSRWMSNIWLASWIVSSAAAQRPLICIAPTLSGFWKVIRCCNGVSYPYET